METIQTAADAASQNHRKKTTRTENPQTSEQSAGQAVLEGEAQK